jgi:hypothetical protein
VAGGGRKYAYAAAVSDERSPRGGRTVCVSRDTAPWRWGDGQLFQKFSAQAWRGKRLKFSAAIRTKAEAAGAGAYTLVRFLPKPNPDQTSFLVGPLATVASAAAPIQAPRWATFAVEADVPHAADSVIIALAMTGNGAAWFGDLAFTAIERSG